MQAGRQQPLPNVPKPARGGAGFGGVTGVSLKPGGNVRLNSTATYTSSSGVDAFVSVPRVDGKLSVAASAPALHEYGIGAVRHVLRLLGLTEAQSNAQHSSVKCQMSVAEPQQKTSLFSMGITCNTAGYKREIRLARVVE